MLTNTEFFMTADICFHNLIFGWQWVSLRGISNKKPLNSTAMS